jgi:hypothetical protein
VRRPAVAFRVDEPPYTPCTLSIVLERHKNAAEGAGPEGRLMSSVKLVIQLTLVAAGQPIAAPRAALTLAGAGTGPEPTAQAEMPPSTPTSSILNQRS